MAGKNLIAGVEHDFGGATGILVIPPLSLGALERLQGKLEALQKETNPMSPQSIATVVDATYAALGRNYPEFTRESVADLVDVGNMHEIIGCVLDVAGIRRKEAEAKKAAAATPAPAGPLPSEPSSGAT